MDYNDPNDFHGLYWPKHFCFISLGIEPGVEVVLIINGWVCDRRNKRRMFYDFGALYMHTRTIILIHSFFMHTCTIILIHSLFTHTHTIVILHFLCLHTHTLIIIRVYGSKTLQNKYKHKYLPTNTVIPNHLFLKSNSRKESSLNRATCFTCIHRRADVEIPKCVRYNTQ